MAGDNEPKDDPDAMDSDEEDEDYVPGADPDERGAASDEDENDAAGISGADDGAPAALSITKQKAVDDAFFDLFGYYYTPTLYGKSQDKLPIKSNKRTISKQRRILSSIFGINSSTKLMAHAKATAALARPKPGSSGGMLRLEKRVITEVKRFAGQEIKVEKVVLVPVMADDERSDADAKMTAKTANATTSVESTATARKAKGVDNLLSELSRPEKLSTISKTTADWDLFKAKNADATLKEQLENKAKGNEAYLVKKDFLTRVDNRRFELERAERDRERAKRGK